ncbi:MAG: ABC transporter ATP-binding protein [Firmicutes bacterium]|nr:ABC transporter ATP-binding protein [Bacillota bacterium]
MGSATPVIETSGLVRRYGDLTAVDHLDLTVCQGEIFGLLGPNGAGKTTTILMLLGLTEPTEGRVRIAGLDPSRQPLEVKRITGYLPDNVGFYDEMTGRDNLRYTAALNGIPRPEAERRIAKALQRVGLPETADRKAGTYSHGMRQRLGLADVLVKEPRIIVLDEPTVGLDPEGARDFLELTRELAREGITVLLSSHLLHQVQEICDRVGIFVSGRMVACGRVHDLAEQILADEQFRLLIEIQAPLPGLATELGRLDGVASVEDADGEEGGGRRLRLACSRDVRAEVGLRVQELGGILLHLEQSGRSLDEIYARYFRGKEMDNVA